MSASGDDRAGVEAGDRVRITIEGEIQSIAVDGHWKVFLRGGGNTTWFLKEELAHATITLLEPEIKVGDWVKTKTGAAVRVLAMDEWEAWVIGESRSRFTLAISTLTRIEPQP